MNDAFPIADREGVLVVVNYSYDIFDSYRPKGRFIVVYRLIGYDHLKWSILLYSNKPLGCGIVSL